MCRRTEEEVYVSTDVTADAASCTTLAVFISALEEQIENLNAYQTLFNWCQRNKYKNCFVLMQLHLMLKIFVCDDWLALRLLKCEKFYSKIFGAPLQD